jgi:hypothetical protein
MELTTLDFNPLPKTVPPKQNHLTERSLRTNNQRD